MLPKFGFDESTVDRRTRSSRWAENAQRGSWRSSVFLREHNRIARLLGQEYPGWDSDRVFATTRNVLTVVLIKIVVEEYINHITPLPFKFALTSAGFTKEPWYRTNWMAIEFNLLYRWHPLVPAFRGMAGS